jgi:hypothetical protein
MIIPLKTREILFKIYAAIAVFITIYHFIGIFYTINETPIWRHVLFVGINLFCVYGALKRPHYFFYFFCVLCIQQFYSHGHYFMKLWTQQGKIHGISVFEFLFLPLAFLCFMEDFKDKKHKQQRI